MDRLKCDHPEHVDYLDTMCVQCYSSTIDVCTICFPRYSPSRKLVCHSCFCDF